MSDSPLFEELQSSGSSSTIVKFEELSAAFINIALFVSLVFSIYAKDILKEKYRELAIAAFGALLALVYLIVGLMCIKDGGTGCLLYGALFLIYGNIGLIYINKNKSGKLSNIKLDDERYINYINAGIFIVAGLLLGYYNYTFTRSFISPQTWVMPLALIMWGLVVIFEKEQIRVNKSLPEVLKFQERYYLVPSIIFAFAAVFYMWSSLEIGLRGGGSKNYNYMILAMICMQMTVITAQLAFTSTINDKDKNSSYEKVTTFLIGVASLGVGGLYLLKQMSCSNQ